MSLKLFLSAILLAASTSVFAAEPAKTSAISYEEVTPAMYKTTQTVKGKIVGTFCNKEMCFLNFNKDYRTKLSAVIVAADFAKFTSLPGADINAKFAALTNKDVQITGMLGEFKGPKDTTGRPQIYLTDVSSLKF